MIYFLIALIACTLGSFIGIGGGIVIIPCLVTLGVPKEIVSVNSALTVFFMALASSIVFIKRKQGDVKTALLLCLGTVPGAILGVHLNKLVSSMIFNIIFTILLLFLMLIMIFKNKLPKIHLSNVTKPIIGVFIGILSGLFGIGGGPLLIPALLILYGLSQKDASATSIYLTLVATIVSVGNYFIAGDRNLSYALYMIPAALIGSTIGVYLNKKVSEKASNIVFKIILFLIFIKELMTIFIK